MVRSREGQVIVEQSDLSTRQALGELCCGNRFLEDIFTTNSGSIDPNLSVDAVQAVVDHVDYSHILL